MAFAPVSCLMIAALAWQAAAPAGKIDPKDWATTTSAEGRFSVKMPGEAEVQAMEGEAGKPGLVIASIKGDDFAYMVLSMPQAPLKDAAAVQKVMDAMLDQLQADLKGKARSRRSQTVNRRTNLRVALAAKPENGLPAGECDALMVYEGGDRLYQLVAIGPAADRVAREAFLASFRPSADKPAEAASKAANPESARLGLKPYGATRGGFTADWPAKPVAQNLRQGNDPRTTQMQAYAVSEKDGTEFGITFTEFVAAPPGPPAEFSRSVARDIVARDKGKLVAERDVTLGEVAGTEVRFDSPASRTAPAGTTVARVFTVGARHYVVLVFGPAGKATSPVATRFLDSFRLTDPAPTPPGDPARAKAKARRPR